MAVSVESTANNPDPQPPRLLSCTELGERALRKIGAFAINDDGADEDDLEETLFWLDLIVAEVVETRRCYWLSPATATFDWPGDTASVVLSDQMGSGYPSTGIVFPVRAWLIDTTTGLRERELELCRRKKYEQRVNTQANGTPDVLFIDRLVDVDRQMAYVAPVPLTDNLYQIALEFQTYSPSVLGVQGGQDAGDVAHGFSRGWQLYLVTRLAAEIGDGPVKRCPNADVRDWRTLAEAYMSALIYSNREKTNRRPVTRRYGG